MPIKKTMEELGRIQSHEYANKNQNGCIVILDNIRSAHNLGSIFRTADAMGVSKIIRCGITPEITHREVQKTALGAELSVPCEYYSNTQNAIENLKNDYVIIAVEQVQNSISLSQFQFSDYSRCAIIFGNEVEGVSEEAIKMSHFCIEIPQAGSKHSLNVSCTASIVLWEWFKNCQNQ